MDMKLISLDELRWFSQELGSSGNSNFTIWQAIVLILNEGQYSQTMVETYFNMLCQRELDAYQKLEALFLEGQLEFYHHNGKSYSYEAITALGTDELGSIFIGIDDAAAALKMLNHFRYGVTSRFHVPHFIFTTLYTEIIRAASGESYTIKHTTYLNNDDFDDVIHTAVFSQSSLNKWSALIKENQLDDMVLLFSKASLEKKSYEIDSDKGLITVLTKLLSKVMGGKFIKSNGEINLSKLTEFICLNVPPTEHFIKKRRLTDLLTEYRDSYDVKTLGNVYLDDLGTKTVIVDDERSLITKESGPISPKYMEAPKSKK